MRSKDFAQMSAAEIEEARKLIKSLVMPDDLHPNRRFAPSSRRFRIDARRSFRRSLQPGGRSIWNFAAPSSVPLRSSRSATFRAR